VLNVTRPLREAGVVDGCRLSRRIFVQYRKNNSNNPHNFPRPFPPTLTCYYSGWYVRYDTIR